MEHGSVHAYYHIISYSSRASLEVLCPFGEITANICRYKSAKGFNVHLLVPAHNYVTVHHGYVWLHASMPVVTQQPSYLYCRKRRERAETSLLWSMVVLSCLWFLVLSSGAQLASFQIAAVGKEHEVLCRL
jgi:hypothetical protein